METNCAVMLPAWSAFTRMRITNDILIRYAIPLQVSPGARGERWNIAVLGGSVAAALERMHERQSRIISKIERSGVDAVSRQDALFMYASQWVEWNAVREPDDPDQAEMQELMDGWYSLYHTRRDKLMN